MRLPDSRKAELQTIWYAATLTLRAKRLTKREIAAIDVSSICNMMLDDSKERITFPVIAALLLGAAKVLRQQSMMIYSDVLHLWSRIRPRLADAEATDAIDLQTSVAKMRKITLTELEHIGPFVPETYYPFADLFDWTFKSPSLPALIDDTRSVTTSAIGTQDQQDEGVEDHYCPTEYVPDTRNVHLLSPGYLEYDYSANVFSGDVQNNPMQQSHEGPADDGQEAVQNLSTADFMDFDYGEQGDILADILDDHQRLVDAAVLRRPGRRLMLSSDTESDDEDGRPNIIWDGDPIPPISRHSTPATEDMSMLHHVPDSSDDESEQDNVPERRARRRQVRHLTSDTSTTVSATFYQQSESLVDVENPRSVFRPKRARKSGSTTDHLFDQPFVSIGIPRTNVMWQHQYKRSQGMMDAEMELARRNQSDSSSVPSVDLLRDTILSGDHHRLHGSRERSRSSEPLIESDDDDQRAHRRRSPEFSRVPEEDDLMINDDMMDYSPGTDAPPHTSREGDADDFLSYAEWMFDQRGEPIALEMLLPPTAHRSEVAQTFYHLLVLASQSKLHPETAHDRIEIFRFGHGVDMVNASAAFEDKEE